MHVYVNLSQLCVENSICWGCLVGLSLVMTQPFLWQILLDPRWQETTESPQGTLIFLQVIYNINGSDLFEFHA